MPHIQQLLTCSLVIVSACQAFTGGTLRTQADSQQKSTMEPWLVGLTAVVGFLFIVFAILIVKRIFFKKDKDEEELQEKELKGYDNKAMEMEKMDETRLTNM